MPHRILIIDDNSDVRLSLRRLFESMSGWEVCGEAINGRDGIEKTQLLNPDLVVLDLSMPEMDGIATAKVLNSIFPALPIIMFTNFVEDQFLEREVLSAGIRQVVSKSDPPGLVRAVQSAFEARAGGLVARTPM